MNFIQHTRAAHEQLTRQRAATPFHVSLYWALFFEWNAGRFPVSLELDHDQLMHAAHIGSIKTYRATLYDLENWGLLAYQPSKSKYTPSRCFMSDLLGAEVPPVQAPTEGTTAPGETQPTEARTAPGDHPAPGPELPPVEVSSGAEVPQPLLIGNKPSTKSKPPVVVNGPAATAKKKEGPAALPDEGLSEVEVFNPDLPADDPGAAPKKKVAPKKKGVHADTIRAAATASPATPRRQEPGRRPETTFQESEIFDKQKFVAAFEGTDYALADLNHYHEAVNLWRDKITGEPPRRADWVATAKRFMFNDATDNRLKLAPNVQRYDPANPGPNNAGGGPARSGYVSKWDR